VQEEEEEQGNYLEARLYVQDSDTGKRETIFENDLRGSVLLGPHRRLLRLPQGRQHGPPDRDRALQLDREHHCRDG
jgi:hypothetical protein